MPIDPQRTPFAHELEVIGKARTERVDALCLYSPARRYAHERSILFAGVR